MVRGEKKSKVRREVRRKGLRSTNNNISVADVLGGGAGGREQGQGNC